MVSGIDEFCLPKPENLGLLVYHQVLISSCPGTGTQIGDTTEARVVGGIFRGSRSPNQPLYM